jgi:hypothetical protein
MKNSKSEFVSGKKMLEKLKSKDDKKTKIGKVDPTEEGEEDPFGSEEEDPFENEEDPFEGDEKEFGSPNQSTYSDYEFYEDKSITCCGIASLFIPSAQFALGFLFLLIMVILFKDDIAWLSPIYNSIQNKM